MFHHQHHHMRVHVVSDSLSIGTIAVLAAFYIVAAIVFGVGWLIWMLFRLFRYLRRTHLSVKPSLPVQSD